MNLELREARQIPLAILLVGIAPTFHSDTIHNTNHERKSK